jgi:hypothetical protein
MTEGCSALHWLQVEITAHRQTTCGVPSKPQHTTKKKKKALTMLPCFPGPFAAAAYIAATTRSMPTKLEGNLTHIPINIPIAAIGRILVIFNKRGDFYTTASF